MDFGYCSYLMVILTTLFPQALSTSSVKNEELGVNEERSLQRGVLIRSKKADHKDICERDKMSLPLQQLSPMQPSMGFTPSEESSRIAGSVETPKVNVCHQCGGMLVQGHVCPCRQLAFDLKQEAQTSI